MAPRRVTRVAKGAPALALLATISLGTALGAEIGRTIDEVRERAKSEPPVEIAVTWRKELASLYTKEIRAKTGIRVNVTRTRGLGSRERILNEAIAGVNKFDIVNVSGELRTQYEKAGVVQQVPWASLLTDADPESFDPKGLFVAASFSKYGIVYNPKLVSKNEVPKQWEDCLLPRWKGKIGVISRPRAFTALWIAWGREKSLDFHRRLKANNPIWTTGQTDTSTKVATGEFPIACGPGLHGVINTKSRDPTAPLEFVMPKELPVQIGEALSLMKHSKSPNASIVAIGYLLSPEGQRHYELQGHSSPFVKNSETAKMMQRQGAKPVWGGWAAAGAEEERLSSEIIEAWGFPTGR